MNRIKTLLINKIVQFALGFAILIIWEVLVNSSVNTMIPSPSQCFIALFELLKEGLLIPDILASLGRVLVGFLIALLIGLTMGFLLGLTPLLKNAVMGILELLRPIPPIAWIPIAVALLGIGNASAWLVIFIGAFYPILTNTMLGVSNIEKLHLEAAKVLGASKLRKFTGVIWPATLPSIFAGMRVGLGFAWMCVVAAEMFASRSGLGYAIQLNRQIFRLDRVIAGMIAIAIIGFLMSRFMSMMERIFVPWRRGHIAKDFFDNTANINIQLPTIRSIPVTTRKKSINQTSKREIRETVLFDWKPSTGVTVNIDNLHFSYPGSQPVLDGINLTIRKGEIFCILGISGCGKTTLLRILAGLENKYTGEIAIEGKHLNGNRDDVTMVFQNFSLFPWRTVNKNVRFGLEQHVDDKQVWDKEVEKMLQLVGLQHKSQEYPHYLSGGQMQRVAFARALATKPKLMLLDEPFSALDSNTRETLQEDMAEIFKRSGATVIMVTHDISEAIFMADRIVIMAPNGGHITNEIINSVPRPRSREFRNSPEFRTMVDTLGLQMNQNSIDKQI
jgi:NitT/TauT family transport system ATP-binding protein